MKLTRHGTNSDDDDNDDNDADTVGGPVIFFPTDPSRAARELRHVTTNSISPGRRMWDLNGIPYLYHTVNRRNYRTAGANFTIHEDTSDATVHGPSSAASAIANFLRDFPQENVSMPTLSLEEGMFLYCLF